jgi:predicted MFS family arabinose efflux permease
VSTVQLPSVSTGISQVKSRLVDSVGGAARLRVILVLGAILGLDSAEQATVAAVSDQLRAAFHISNTQVGLLLAIVSFITAVASLPIGILADRMSRRLILMIAVAGWAAAMVLSGTATSYTYLVITEVALGGVTAASWPCIASLTGDFSRPASAPRFSG